MRVHDLSVMLQLLGLLAFAGAFVPRIAIGIAGMLIFIFGGALFASGWQP